MPHGTRNKRFSTLKRIKTGGIQPKLNVACFVQSCLADADFVVFSNYCLIGTRRSGGVFGRSGKVNKNYARRRPVNNFCSPSFFCLLNKTRWGCMFSPSSRKHKATSLQEVLRCIIPVVTMKPLPVPRSRRA